MFDALQLILFLALCPFINIPKNYSTLCFQVWDLQNLRCLQTLRGHTRDVMSILCWDKFLLSASLDKTLKVGLSPNVLNLYVRITFECFACHVCISVSYVLSCDFDDRCGPQLKVGL